MRTYNSTNVRKERSENTRRISRIPLRPAAVLAAAMTGLALGAAGAARATVLFNSTFDESSNLGKVIEMASTNPPKVDSGGMTWAITGDENFTKNISPLATGTVVTDSKAVDGGQDLAVAVPANDQPVVLQGIPDSAIASRDNTQLSFNIRPDIASERDLSLELYTHSGSTYVELGYALMYFGSKELYYSDGTGNKSVSVTWTPSDWYNFAWTFHQFGVINAYDLKVTDTTANTVLLNVSSVPTSDTQTGFAIIQPYTSGADGTTTAGSYSIDAVSMNTVPEPATLGLLVIGGLGLLLAKTRRT